MLAWVLRACMPRHQTVLAAVNRDPALLEAGACANEIDQQQHTPQCMLASAKRSPLQCPKVRRDKAQAHPAFLFVLGPRPDGATAANFRGTTRGIPKKRLPPATAFKSAVVAQLQTPSHSKPQLGCPLAPTASAPPPQQRNCAGAVSGSATAALGC